MAYRSKKEERRVEAASGGLVVDMVRQFADRHAFVRELVQNGIDAGARSIEMRATYLGGEATFSVRDDGEGMTRDIIEGPLLTLFNSAKDEDDTKIGKYGVGFVSVFAIDPDEVIVESWRQGESWALTLAPDHSYELATGDERSRASASGTTVTLRKRMDREAFREHTEEVAQSLHHWCKHARLPIHWRVDEEGGEPQHRRVDEPLAVSSPVSLESEMEGMRIVLGPGAGVEIEEGAPPKPTTFAGFYNHGLTLYEAASSPKGLVGIRFKVDSPALSHTLSRDNVRHDDAYELALRRVRELVFGPLRRAVIERVAECTNDPELVDERPGVLLAACTPTLQIEPSDILLPLCDEVEGGACLSADGLHHEGIALYSAEPTRITKALARQGQPVLLADWPVAVLETLATKIGRTIFPASSVYALLSPLTSKQAKRGDQALEAGVHEMLNAAGVSTTNVRLARVGGASLDTAGARVESALEPQLVAAEERGSRFRFGRPPELMLDVRHEAVRAARALAKTDATSAAHLLSRYLIVEAEGEVEKGQSDALLAVAAGGAA